MYHQVLDSRFLITHVTRHLFAWKNSAGILRTTALLVRALDSMCSKNNEPNAAQSNPSACVFYCYHERQALP